MPTTRLKEIAIVELKNFPGKYGIKLTVQCSYCGETYNRLASDRKQIFETVSKYREATWDDHIGGVYKGCPKVECRKRVG